MFDERERRASDQAVCTWWRVFLMRSAAGSDVGDVTPVGILSEHWITIEEIWRGEAGTWLKINGSVSNMALHGDFLNVSFGVLSSSKTAQHEASWDWCLLSPSVFLHPDRLEITVSVSVVYCENCSEKRLLSSLQRTESEEEFWAQASPLPLGGVKNEGWTVPSADTVKGWSLTHEILILFINTK